MAQKNGRGIKVKTTFEMVNVDFTGLEKLEVSAWFDERTVDFLQEQLDIVDSGYKLSVSRDEYHDCYVVSLTNKSLPKTTKVSYVYLFRHNMFDKCLGSAVFYWANQLARGENIIEPVQDKYDW